MSSTQGGPNNNNNASSTAPMIALYNFEAESEPEISLKQNEQIEVLDMDPALNGWAYARKKSGAEGYVPISYLGRSHKSSKSVTQSRSTSPNPNKPRFEDKNNGYQRNNKYVNNVNNVNQRPSSYNQQNQNKQINNNYNKSQNKNNYPNTDDSNNVNPMKVTNNINNNNMNNNAQQHHSQNNQHQNNKSNQSSPLNNNNNNNNNSDVPDARQIICSFHRDFIPEMNDLYKYFGEFGKVTNKIEIEYDSKKVPLAKIKFQSPQCVNKVVEKGNRQQIPSGQQNGTIHIRVYRSMQDYLNNTQRSNRGPYNKHKSNRRGGF